MRILISDDEKLTRSGIESGINWSSLGIIEVLTAEDGLYAFDMAMQNFPDILLTDVRMPRMDGINLAQKLQEIKPSMPIIFMSGYSDKEYLKAAIKLKAVSYVEKPIDLSELTEALAEAVNNVKANNKVQSSKNLSIKTAKAELASKLISPSKASDDNSYYENLDFDFPYDTTTPFFTLLVNISHSNLSADAHETMISSALSTVFAKYNLREIHSTRQSNLFCFHIWGFDKYTNHQKEVLAETIEAELNALGLSYRIIFGKNVEGAKNIHASYNSAVIEMQNAFFIKLNTHCIYKHQDSYEVFPDLSGRSYTERYVNALEERNESEAYQVIAQLHNDILNKKNSLPNQLRELYYRMILSIAEANRHNMIVNNGEDDPADNILEKISECESVFELDELLKAHTAQYFAKSADNSEDHSTIYLIKQYISENFSNEDLSIKDISDYVHLSTSYICTLFKTETSKTLNQYITDYRIERAKKLLEDPRNKVSEISSKVGYRDGNYFGKTFKKQVGLSPSEYRDREI